MDDLSAPRILAGVDGTRFQRIEVYASLPSTQTLLVAEGGPDGRVLIADHQSAGRGRVGRRWASPPGVSLMLSALARDVPATQAPLTSLAAGVAVAEAVESLCGIEVGLKWPNDVQVGGRKLCGMLGELAPTGDYLVVGIGVNVRQGPDDFPPDVEATSLALEACEVDRSELCAGILRGLDGLLGSSDWLDAYRRRCVTLGARVRVELGDETVTDVATDVRDDGALVVGGRPVIAGDVIHVRKGEPDAS